jgi:Glyoxalase-like domain
VIDSRISMMRTVLTLSVGLTVAVNPGAVPDEPSLHLDHVPIAVRDLPAALAEFRGLGFTIKPARPHQNGIENASVKFVDGSYVELITSHGASDSTSREYEEFLRDQEGAAYVFLRDQPRGAFSARALKAGGRREASGPFAFTELPAAWKSSHLQVIEYLAPSNDAATTYQHANGARRVVAIWMLVDRRSDPIVQAFGAMHAGRGAFAFEKRETEAARLADGTCLMFTPRGAQDPARSTALAILIEVDSLTGVPRLSGRPFTERGPAVWLSPSQMHGVWLGFMERTAWAGLRCAA